MIIGETLPPPPALPAVAERLEDFVFAAFSFDVAEFYGLDCEDVIQLVAGSPEYNNPAIPCTAAGFDFLAVCIADALGVPATSPAFVTTLH